MSHHASPKYKCHLHHSQVFLQKKINKKNDTEPKKRHPDIHERTDIGSSQKQTSANGKARQICLGFCSVDSITGDLGSRRKEGYSAEGHSAADFALERRRADKLNKHPLCPQQRD